MSPQILSSVEQIWKSKPFLPTTQKLQLSTEVSIPDNALWVQGFPFHQQEQDSANLEHERKMFLLHPILTPLMMKILAHHHHRPGE